MNCKDIKPLISELIDNELDLKLKKEVKNHLQNCQECKHWYEKLVSLNNRYSKVAAPNHIKHQILDKIKSENKVSIFDSLSRIINKLLTGKGLVVTTSLVVAFLVTFIALSDPDKTFKEPSTSLPKTSAVLPSVGSFNNLKKLLADQPTFDFPHSGFLEESMSLKKMTRATGAKPDYSTTNIQVEGVDEADRIKTDGKYIYQINKENIVIAEIYPPDEMKIVKIIKEDFSPSELYVDDKYLIVIGYATHDNPEPKKLTRRSLLKRVLPEIYPSPPDYRETTKTVIYDISDKTEIKKIREVELEGNYISSRKIGSSLYIVTNKYIEMYHIMEQNLSITPSYRDSISSKTNKFIKIDYKDIKYFPKAVEPNYILVGALNLETPSRKMQVSTYLGSGQSIYASLNNLYVATTQYEQPKEKAVSSSTQTNTGIFKFALKNGTVKYTGKGIAPGTILNQFSMDEHNDYFRIATTKNNDTTKKGETVSKNNIYILNTKLQIIGKVEDIAPGENIYSTRFVDDRAYMVTFKTVDPFFVVDLKNPKSPKILGALKIPGYSNYLHPYDENHIVGFGKDTTERKDMAYYQGLKIAIFDVSDVKNPIEKSKTIIGDRGTDSELLQNHKALLFDKDRNLLAFPVTVMEIKEKKSEGEFIFQGAYIYNISLTDGLKLKGKITHLSNEDYKKAGLYWGGSNKDIERIIYIDDVLYTLSKEIIKANDLNNLKEINMLEISNNN